MPNKLYTVFAYIDISQSCHEISTISQFLLSWYLFVDWITKAFTPCFNAKLYKILHQPRWPISADKKKTTQQTLNSIDQFPVQLILWYYLFIVFIYHFMQMYPHVRRGYSRFSLSNLRHNLARKLNASFWWIEHTLKTSYEREKIKWNPVSHITCHHITHVQFMQSQARIAKVRVTINEQNTYTVTIYWKSKQRSHILSANH